MPRFYRAPWRASSPSGGPRGGDERFFVDPNRLPVVPVQVVEAPPEHGAVVDGLHRGCASGRQRPLDQGRDVVAARARQREQALGVRGRVALALVRERSAVAGLEQHDERVLVHDHAGGVRVREARLELEAEPTKELERTTEVVHREVQEQAAGWRGHAAWTPAAAPNHRSGSASAGSVSGRSNRGNIVSTSRNAFQAAIPSPASSSTMSAHAKWPPASFGRYCPNAGCPPEVPAGTSRDPRHSAPGPTSHPRMDAGPRSQSENGGIENVASSRSNPARASTS